MTARTAAVDGFRFLPPKLSAWIRSTIPEAPFSGAIPFTPLEKPLSETTVSLVTSAGISLKTDAPFDMEREKREPTYGDPTWRAIPRGTTGKDVAVNHLHINTSYIAEDINVMLPLTRMAELEADGVIGALAPTSYSFYGFQWEGEAFIEQAIAPMTEQMTKEGVGAVFLTPA
ncbi:MAG: glycine/sarcosine/betaine reductase selenoprotein B family protein [Pseudomonadota bacterium]